MGSGKRDMTSSYCNAVLVCVDLVVRTLQLRVQKTTIEESGKEREEEEHLALCVAEWLRFVVYV